MGQPAKLILPATEAKGHNRLGRRTGREHPRRPAPPEPHRQAAQGPETGNGGLGAKVRGVAPNVTRKFPNNRLPLTVGQQVKLLLRLRGRVTAGVARGFSQWGCWMMRKRTTRQGRRGQAGKGRAPSEGPDLPRSGVRPGVPPRHTTTTAGLKRGGLTRAKNGQCCRPSAANNYKEMLMVAAQPSRVSQIRPERIEIGPGHMYGRAKWRPQT